jgi:hypothetical protein
LVAGRRRGGGNRCFCCDLACDPLHHKRFQAELLDAIVILATVRSIFRPLSLPHTPMLQVHSLASLTLGCGITMVPASSPQLPAPVFAPTLRPGTRPLIAHCHVRRRHV